MKEPRAVVITKTETGFGFNVRGQVSEGGETKLDGVENKHPECLKIFFITRCFMMLLVLIPLPKDFTFNNGMSNILK